MLLTVKLRAKKGPKHDNLPPPRGALAFFRKVKRDRVCEGLEVRSVPGQEVFPESTTQLLWDASA